METKRGISIKCPFCRGQKMFQPRNTADPLAVSGSPVVCYLCRGRGRINARSEQPRDIQAAIKEIEQAQRTKRDLADFHAQNR